MSALVVEDSPVVGRLVSTLLKDLGFDTVNQALDGFQALEKMREKRYRLVISDFVMMPMTGLELLKAVRADWRLRDTCFLMMTGTTEFEQVTAAHNAGVDAYLLKPFTAATLQLRIDEALQRRAEERLANALARRPRRRPV